MSLVVDPEDKTPDALNEPEEVIEPDRRKFIGTLAYTGGTLFIGAWIYAAWRALKSLPHPPRRRLETALDARSVTGVHVLDRAIVTRDQKGKLIALDRRCTHLGCPVNLSKDKKNLLCPCHGSAYSVSGKVIKGPAQQDLKPLKVTVNKNGKVVIHG